MSTWSFFPYYTFLESIHMNMCPTNAPRKLLQMPYNPWCWWLPWFFPSWKFQHEFILYLVGGFNPFEKYESNRIISPGIGVEIKNVWNHQLVIHLYTNWYSALPSTYLPSTEMVPLKCLPFQTSQTRPTTVGGTRSPPPSTGFCVGTSQVSGLPKHNLPHQPLSRGIACLRKASFASWYW